MKLKELLVELGFLLLVFSGCKTNTQNIELIQKKLDCDFPPSQSSFGYEKKWVGNQFLGPVSDEIILARFLNMDTIPSWGGLAFIEPSGNYTFIYNKFISSNISTKGNKILFRADQGNQPYLFDWTQNTNKPIETNPKRSCSNFQFNATGSKFLYTCEDRNELINPLLIIRDSALNLVDSFYYLQIENVRWNNFVWINDTLLAFSSENSEATFSKIGLFNLKNRIATIIYQTPILSQKDFVTTIAANGLNYSNLYFCNGHGVYRLNLTSKLIDQEVLQSCDSLEYSSVSIYNSSTLLLEKTTRTKKSEMILEEKRSVFLYNHITKTETLLVK